MAEISNTIKISAPISPYDTNDVHPTHEAKWGKGGHRSTKTLIERNLIPLERRELGMIVYVEESKTFYTLRSGIENNHWVDFALSFENSAGSHLVVSYEEPENPDVDTAWFNLNTGGLVYRDSTNTSWTPAIAYAVDGGEF